MECEPQLSLPGLQHSRAVSNSLWPVTLDQMECEPQHSLPDLQHLRCKIPLQSLMCSYDLPSGAMWMTSNHLSTTLGVNNTMPNAVCVLHLMFA
ncbi:uncharacterized protein LOC119742135 isoform X2 [Patiria miniata]|uniref:Uncharacterized protein n=1 Tax=Patiria miniata TaxID=46514 RepID=A0A914BE08_PATMI|nr:uncharacterized protein LOC119742135 isoform X2 [Patiria miniata]